MYSRIEPEQKMKEVKMNQKLLPWIPLKAMMLVFCLLASLGVANADNNEITYSGRNLSNSSDGILDEATRSASGAKSTATKQIVLSGNQVTSPVITMADDSNQISITASDGASIYYTIDGTTPSTASTHYTGTFSVANNATVKAVAVLNGMMSSIAESTFHGSKGVDRGVVTLDDRENHTWNYYQTGSPISSPDPRDVKITYQGNGAQVSKTEDQDSFVYYKTLEKTNGQYAYTTIPNPFSKRPKDGSTYKGFSAWEVVSISGGTLSDGSTTYAVGSQIPAEKDVYFSFTGTYTPNTISAEVVLKAVWVNATVIVYTSGTPSASTFSGFAGGTYETNFIVVHRTSSTSVATLTTNLSYPATITMVTPDGATDYRSSSNYLKGNFTCKANTKFEYVNINNYDNDTYTAAGYDLVLGRGISNTTSGELCVTWVRGYASAPTTMNYKLRIESGIYNNVSFINGYTYYNGESSTSYSYSSFSYTGDISIRSTLGCDYDRSTATNTKLIVNDEVILAATRGAYNKDSNLSKETLRVVVKSGDYYFRDNVSNGDPSFYIGMAASGSPVVKTGERKLIVEGGIFSNIAGGIETVAASGRPSVNIRIKGGTIHGSVYGAALYAAAYGDRKLVLTGGDVEGWIAGGCNGQQTSGGIVAGDTYVYVGGTTEVRQTSTDPQIGYSYGGNVYGAGSGNSGAAGTDATVGQVNNSTVVVADGAVISRNVYGGGNYGHTEATANVYVKGATVEGSVFGGSNQQRGTVANVSMTSGTVLGGVYGGSNTSGTISGNVAVSVIGGTVGASATSANVHGGGYGSSTAVSGNVNVVIGASSTPSQPVVYGSVYGGSALGSVNTSDSNTTLVTVNNGIISGDVYGGGLGNSSTEATVRGNIVVVVNNGTINNVYGGGNIFSNPSGTITVTINGSDTPASAAYTINNVYGGGNLAGYTNNDSGTTVSVKGGYINNVFGGGHAASVKTAIVNVSGGEVINCVYGGAEGTAATPVLVLNNNTLNMWGGHVHNSVYGGSKTCNDASTTFVNISGGRIDRNVYGSGYKGSLAGSTYVYIGENAILNAPNHAANTAAVYGIAPLHIAGSVYAGADWGSFSSGTFGASTITGVSNIYIDGTGYDNGATLQNNYIFIGGSVYGSGTSCYAGTTDHSVYIRNYGQVAAGSKDANINVTRQMGSIQMCKNLVLDNVHVQLNGVQLITSFVPTEQYGVHSVDDVMRLVNGSSLLLAMPLDRVKKLGSYTCTDVYAATPTYTVVGYAGLGNYGAADNKIRILEGGYLAVRYVSASNTLYGELEGFCHMVEPGGDGINNEGYCFARPKGLASPYDNTTDGGFVSYDASHNTFDANGAVAANGVQMPYTNRTPSKSDTQYYRFWRFQGNGSVSTVYGYIVAQTNNSGNAVLSTNCTVQLPPASSTTSYFRVKSIDFGTIDRVLDAAMSGSGWIAYNSGSFGTASNAAITESQNALTEDPNSTFGLTSTFSGAFATASTAKIYNNDSYGWLKTNNIANIDNVISLPTINFALTYSNALTLNSTKEVVITLCEYDNNNNLLQTIYTHLIINTLTSIGQDVEISLFANIGPSISGIQSSSNVLLLPAFTMTAGAESSTVNWDGKTALTTTTSSTMVSWNGIDGQNFAVKFRACDDATGSNGWLTQNGTYDFIANNPTQALGTADGRKFFSVGFDLGYDATDLWNVTTYQTGQHFIGDLKIHVKLTNCADDSNGFYVTVHIYVVGAAKFFYLDGVNGHGYNNGLFADKAKATLAQILNSNDYQEGDYIFEVNKVTAHVNSELSWDGTDYNSVTVYRYPGSHYLSNGTTTLTGFDNTVYKGIMVDVPETSTFSLNHVTIDGSYGFSGVHSIYNPGTNTVNATSPLVNVASNSTFNIGGGAALTNNYNVTAGGAGGAYMQGTMNLNGLLTIYSNKTNGKDCNLMLPADANYTTIITPLDANCIIGITKEIPDGQNKTIVATAANESLAATAIQRATLMYDDQDKYAMYHVNISNDEFLCTNDYFVKTWVSAVTSQPSGFDANNIDSREELAWAISIVNGRNGQTAAPATNFNVTADLDMKEYMWMPIGDDAHSYTGTFTGNGHVIDGLYCYLPFHYGMGMFGNTSGATLNGVFARSSSYSGSGDRYSATPSYLGILVGKAVNTTIKYSGASGRISDDYNLDVMGGFVGLNDGTTIHSSNVYPELNGYNMGGLVGKMASGTLANSYGIPLFTDRNESGSTTGYACGVVGDYVSGTINNIYVGERDAQVAVNASVKDVLGGSTTATNVYSDTELATLLGNAHGVPTFTKQTPYTDAVTVNGTKLLDALDANVSGEWSHWMYENQGRHGDTKWHMTTYNGTSGSSVNRDYPILAHSQFKSAMASAVDNFGLVTYGDHLNVTIARANTDIAATSLEGVEATVVLYNDDDISSTTASNGDGSKIELYINEDVSLLHNSVLTAYTGVTLDNSSTSTGYDWHMVSPAGKTSLIGVGYADNNEHVWGETLNECADPDGGTPAGYYWIKNDVDGFFPKEISMKKAWDIYNYFEPEYHWINFKRNSNSHWHENWDTNPTKIDYYYDSCVGTSFTRIHKNETYMQPGRGYMVACKLDTLMRSSTELNYGDVHYLVTCEGEYLTGNNLIGNPYQSYLDFDALRTSTTWNGTSDIQNTYVILDADNNGYVAYYDGTSTGSATAQRYINMHQGFFIQADRQVDLTFTNAMRTNTSTGSNFREEQPAYPLVNLFVADAAGKNDIAVVELSRPENGGAQKLKGIRSGDGSLYTHYNDTDYSIAFIGDPVDNVPVWFEAEADGEYTMRWTTANGTFTYLHLTDNITGADVDCLATDHYTFTASTNDFKSRFKLRFNYTDVAEDAGEANHFAYFDGNNWIVEGEGTLELLDVNGRVLECRELTDSRNSISTEGLSAAMYLMRLTNGEKVSVQKIVVK